jgi:hypothetical protein
MSKRKTYGYKPLPKEDGLRSGCKVGWRYYRSREAAEACSKAAKHNAQIDLSLGYDFGYCSPGSIRWSEDGFGKPERAGMWEVCVS